MVVCSQSPSRISSPHLYRPPVHRHRATNLDSLFPDGTGCWLSKLTAQPPPGASTNVDRIRLHPSRPTADRRRPAPFPSRPRLHPGLLTSLGAADTDHWL